MKLHQRNQIFVKSSLKVFVGFFWLVVVFFFGGRGNICRILNVHHLGNIFLCTCNHAHKLSCIFIHT